MSGSTNAMADVEAVRRELRSLQTEADHLRTELARTERDAAQARALAEEEAHEATRMEQLEQVLDLVAVTHHVRGAVARAPLGEGPIRSVAVADLLPEAVRQAAIDAIPAPVFRDQRTSGQITVPPKVGPTRVVATWMFLNDVAKDLIGPALLARASEPHPVPESELKLVRSVLVRSTEPGMPAPDETLTVAVGLGEYDWHVGLKATGKPVSASRRRHGDVASWAPRDEGLGSGGRERAHDK